MTESLRTLWEHLSQLVSTPLGTILTVIGAYLLLQLVVLPKLGVPT